MKTLKILALTAIISTLSMAQKEALLIGVSDYQGDRNDSVINLVVVVNKRLVVSILSYQKNH